jgi:hypothetical protein
MVINFVGLGWVCVLCGVWVGQGACAALEQSFFRTGVRFPHKLFRFCLNLFMLLLFWKAKLLL